MTISEHTCHHCMKDFIEDDESIHESITFSCGVDRTGKRWKSVYKTIDDWYCDSDCRYMEAMLDCG